MLNPSPIYLRIQQKVSLRNKKKKNGVWAEKKLQTLLRFNSDNLSYYVHELCVSTECPG